MNPKIVDSRGDKIFKFCNYTLLALITLVVLYPLIFIVSSSFSSTTAVVSGQVWLWPVDFSLEGYKTIFENSQVWAGYGNSIFYTVVGTAINVFLTVVAAYPLSRRDFRGWQFFMFLFIFTMMFNGGLIPTYLLVNNLGMLDTRWALLIPNALAVFNVIIARTFFKSTIPEELRESAQMDGASDFRFLWSIVLPLSGPIIAVLALFYAVGHWNSYFDALIYLDNQDLFPLQLILREILAQNKMDPQMMGNIDPDVQRNMAGLKELLKYALIVVASVPVLVIYPFVQKHFVKGVLIGSVKE